MMDVQGLVATVGGSPEPLVKTLEVHVPPNVLFVVSDRSRSYVESEIMPRLRRTLSVSEYSPQYEYLEVSDHENIGTCYRQIREGMDGWLARRLLDPDTVFVDITGGTKAMTAALTLAGVERFRRFTYVGGEMRDRDDTGVVMAGSERVVRTENPWDTYAVRDLERANHLLSEFHADLASEVLGSAAQKSGDAHRRRLYAFAALAEALALADRFSFRQAVNVFNRRCRVVLEHTLDYPVYRELLALCGHWQAVEREVSAVKETPGEATLLELLANSDRRAKQSRYDDAVGRLYRAVELRGQHLVRQAFGAELGNLSLDHFPVDRRDEVVAELRLPKDGRFRVGVMQLYRVLSFSENPSVRHHSGVYDSLADHLTMRNQSLFAHGVQPVTERGFGKFWEDALRAMEIGEADVPRWPALDLRLG